MSARVAIAVAVLLIGARPARGADVCPKSGDSANGPLMGGTGPADFGAVPEVCGATDGVLRLRADHVIAAMVEGLGGHVTRHDAPFDPEIGAYAGTAHAHDEPG